MHYRIVGTLKGFYQFYRISDWIHYVGFGFLGVVLAGQRLNVDFWRTVEVLAASCLLLAFAYSFNLVYDWQREASSGLRENVTPFGRVGGLLSLVTGFAGLALLMPTPQSFPPAILFVFLSIFYSHPATRLKRFPILCTIINGVWFPLLFLMGASSVATISGKLLLIYLLLVLLQLPAQLIHEAAHLDVDSLVGDLTTAVHFGPKRALDGSVTSLAAASILTALMLFSGTVNWFMGLSLGIFAISFGGLLISERQQPQPIDYSLVRTRYRRGGILVGLLLVLTSLL